MEALTEARFGGPRVDCKHPERWHSLDGDSTELEVTELVAAFVRALQPNVVLETGSAFGQTAEAIGEALHENGHGHLITFEPDVARAKSTLQRCMGLPVSVRVESSIDGLQRMLSTPNAEVDFFWLDSLFELRPRELDHARHLLSPGGVVGIHDTAAHHPLWRALEDNGHLDGWRFLKLPTPRGVTFLQLA